MACCGQRITKKKKVIVPESKEVVYSVSGDVVKIAYNGDMTIKVNGCVTGNRYLFCKGTVRIIDSEDAQCLFDLMPGTFQEVIEVVKKTAKKVVVEEVKEDGIEADYTESYIESTEN